MGGKGGLNILPQKKWNVYNWDNRIKVIENEKLVKKEIEKFDRKRKDKNLSDKVKVLKSGEKDICMEKYNFSSEEQYDKNKIFKEIMERKSMDKKLKVDLLFDKMQKPMKSEDHLKFFENEEDEKNYFKEEDEKTSQIHKITFKESIRNNLNPWYSQKKKEDYEYYRNQYLEKDKKSGSESMLGKKHKIETEESISKHKNVEKDKLINKKTKSIEELRKERLEREKNEKEKINQFLKNKILSNN